MEISIQTGNIIERLGPEKGYKMIRKAGFTAIDWNLDHSCRKKDMTNGTYQGKCIFEQPIQVVREHYARELEFIQKNQLAITQVHAPYPPYLPEQPKLIEYVLEIDKRLIEFCNEINCKKIVMHGIHPFYEVKYQQQIDQLEYARELNLQFFSALIPTLLQYDVTVCLENLCVKRSRDLDVFEGFCSDPDEAVYLIDTLNDIAGSQIFGLCLDSGHLNLIKRNPMSYIGKLGNRIKATHLHDNDGINDQHRAPFSGNINWRFICRALKEAGYSGDISFETFQQIDRVLDFDEEILFPWLQLIYTCGKAFADVISN